jgi:hypothetical protein
MDLNALKAVSVRSNQASAHLAEILTEFGASVERSIAGLPTAFEARQPAGEPGPKVAIVAEYDALPEVGHAVATTSSRRRAARDWPWRGWASSCPEWWRLSVKIAAVDASPSPYP